MRLPELTDHLGYWLRQVSNHVSHAFARKLAERDVTVAEWVFLRLLYDGPIPPSRLAEHMSLTRGAVTKLADRMIAKGFVERAADPQDGRAQTLALTTSGAGFVPDLGRLADANETECFGAMPAHDRRTLERLLKDYVRRLGVAQAPLQ